MLAPRHIGGRMLTSAGHWKELVHLGGVSEEALLRVAERACAGLWSGEVMREITLREKVRKFHAQELVSIWDYDLTLPEFLLGCWYSTLWKGQLSKQATLIFCRYEGEFLKWKRPVFESWKSFFINCSKLVTRRAEVTMARNIAPIWVRSCN